MSQRSEFLLEHGAIDTIIDRREMRDTLARILAKFMNLPSTEQEHRVDHQSFYFNNTHDIDFHNKKYLSSI